jgi:AAA15 family ATPase/GTPase
MWFSVEKRQKTTPARIIGLFVIIDFTVTNFRSIKSSQFISLHATKKTRVHSGNVSLAEDGLGVLKTCSIYGPNASGKTNLIRAIDAFRDVVLDSSSLKEDEEIGSYQPYILSNQTTQSPTTFEMEFYAFKKRYSYSISFTKYEIIYEKLDYFPTARSANIFTRTSSDWKSIKFGEHYKGGRKQISLFKNSSYISRAGNSPDTPDIIKEIYSTLSKNILTINANQSIGVFGWYNDNKISKAINTFLRKVDLGIDKFELEHNSDVDISRIPDSLPSFIREKLLMDLAQEEYFYHPKDNGELVKFSKDMESLGTKKLFHMLPPIIEILKDGSTLFIDEIESSLHPHIAELVVKIFNDPLTNLNNAQLIFTTHNMNLMSQSLQRKDQIYIVQKSLFEGTTFTCLDEFNSVLKDSSPFAKWYDEGRLGGIPYVDYLEISSAIVEAIGHAEKTSEV